MRFVNPVAELRTPVAPAWHPWGDVSTGMFLLVLAFVIAPLAFAALLLEGVSRARSRVRGH